MMKEKTYYMEAVVSNWDEWEQHAKKVLENRGSKTDDEVLEEIVKFDYKINFISVQRPISSSETPNP